MEKAKERYIEYHPEIHTYFIELSNHEYHQIVKALKLYYKLNVVLGNSCNSVKTVLDDIYKFKAQLDEKNIKD